MNSSEIYDILLGFNQSSSIFWSNSIAYLNNLVTKFSNFSFPSFESVINLGIASIKVTIISKHISLKLSSKSTFSEIFPIKMKISWKYFLKIFGSQLDKSLIESRQTFKFSLSFALRQFKVVSRTLKIKSLNCLASFFDIVPQRISVRHWTVFAFNDKELLLK